MCEKGQLGGERGSIVGVASATLEHAPSGPPPVKPFWQQNKFWGAIAAGLGTALMAVPIPWVHIVGLGVTAAAGLFTAGTSMADFGKYARK